MGDPAAHLGERARPGVSPWTGSGGTQPGTPTITPPPGSRGGLCPEATVQLGQSFGVTRTCVVTWGPRSDGRRCSGTARRPVLMVGCGLPAAWSTQLNSTRVPSRRFWPVGHGPGPGSAPTAGCTPAATNCRRTPPSVPRSRSGAASSRGPLSAASRSASTAQRPGGISNWGAWVAGPADVGLSPTRRPGRVGCRRSASTPTVDDRPVRVAPISVRDRNGIPIDLVDVGHRLPSVVVAEGFALVSDEPGDRRRTTVRHRPGLVAEHSRSITPRPVR